MFASRTHLDENAIHHQQTAAASKPLNGGIKGLAPKTPGNSKAIPPKTPLGRKGQDENAVFGTAKMGFMKGAKDGELFGGDLESGKPDRSAFITPAGPKQRAPLGNKTTNVKATAFHTPAQPATTRPNPKPTSPRLRRGKVHIDPLSANPLNETATNPVPEEDDVPEIEYMPPRAIPLPDLPADDWPPERTYPQLQGENFTRGWWSEFAPRKDHEHETEEEHGTREQREFLEKLRRVEERERKMEVEQRKAAALLAAPQGRAAVPSFAAPTAASARARTVMPVVKKTQGMVSAGKDVPRHTVAKAASNTTLGYSRGRRVLSSTSTAQPLPAVQEDSPSTANNHQLVAESSALHLPPQPKGGLAAQGGFTDEKSKSDLIYVEDEESNAAPGSFLAALFSPPNSSLTGFSIEDDFQGFRLEAMEDDE